MRAFLIEIERYDPFGADAIRRHARNDEEKNWPDTTTMQRVVYGRDGEHALNRIPYADNCGIEYCGLKIIKEVSTSEPDWLDGYYLD